MLHVTHVLGYFIFQVSHDFSILSPSLHREQSLAPLEGESSVLKS